MEMQCELEETPGNMDQEITANNYNALETEELHD